MPSLKSFLTTSTSLTVASSSHHLVRHHLLVLVHWHLLIIRSLAKSHLAHSHRLHTHLLLSHELLVWNHRILHTKSFERLVHVLLTIHIIPLGSVHLYVHHSLSCHILLVILLILVLLLLVSDLILVYTLVEDLITLEPYSSKRLVSLLTIRCLVIRLGLHIASGHTRHLLCLFGIRLFRYVAIRVNLISRVWLTTNFRLWRHSWGCCCFKAILIFLALTLYTFRLSLILCLLESIVFKTRIAEGLRGRLLLL
jgi:hypothetical protein